MPRPSLAPIVPALTALALSLAAAPLAAQDAAPDKADHCARSAAIVGNAVAERVAGAPQDKTVAAITAALEGDDARYADAVPPIVEWIYSLPEDQLTDEVAPAYEAACLEQ